MSPFHRHVKLSGRLILKRMTPSIIDNVDVNGLANAIVTLNEFSR